MCRVFLQTPVGEGTDERPHEPVRDGAGRGVLRLHHALQHHLLLHHAQHDLLLPPLPRLRVGALRVLRVVAHAPDRCAHLRVPHHAGRSGRRGVPESLQY